MLCGGVLLVTLTTAAWQVSAQDSSPLRGDLFIAGKTPIDPPPNEPKNSHAYLTISGPAALRMYRGMRAREEPDACEPGKKLKRAGALGLLDHEGRQGRDLRFLGRPDQRRRSTAERPC